ncbi:hypothetical protein NQ317_011395 [Molorchus minor]|uniref:Uncharacterized protein n=1 Tax=Molorchus minor TaxID=1323400 RepID=A0ABQ9JR76_9CUCU|nr:hypothetical protein NQ317_011395 [Molorchus minor]
MAASTPLDMPPQRKTADAVGCDLLVEYGKIIRIYTFIQASEEPHGSCARKGWPLLFAMAPWERLKFILVTHLLYSPEKTQKTRNITNSRAGEISMKKIWMTQCGFELTLPTLQHRKIDRTTDEATVAIQDVSKN